MGICEIAIPAGPVTMVVEVWFLWRLWCVPSADIIQERYRITGMRIFVAPTVPITIFTAFMSRKISESAVLALPVTMVVEVWFPSHQTLELEAGLTRHQQSFPIPEH